MNKTITKSIDENTQKSFFSKKNTFLIVLTFLLSLALVALTIIYILKIDWGNLFTQFTKGFGYQFSGIWFTLLLLFIPWVFFSRAITITIKLKQLGYKIKFWDKLMYTTTTSFLAAVTPANFVTDPYTIFWLKTHGISTSKASALITYNALVWEVAQLTITLPSLVWIIVKWQDIFGSGAIDATGGLTVFIFMIIGIAIDFIGFAVTIVTGFSRNLHYLLSRIFNRLKKLLNLSYHTKEQTYQTYVVEAKMQREFLSILKKWKTTCIGLLIVVINEVYIYMTVVWSLQFMAGWHSDFTLNWLEIFNVANVTTTANRFVPLPGNELSIEWIMKEFMRSKIGGITPTVNPDDPNDQTTFLINNSIMVWRSWTSYFPAIIGAFGFCSLTITQIKQYRQRQKK